MMRPKKLYVGCSLTHATQEFRDGIEKLKDALRQEGHEILDFLWVLDKKPSPKAVFEWDILNCVKNCDGMVAICDHPSLGLGYELAEAAHLGKPILALAQKEVRISNLILGAAEVLPSFRLKRYEDINKDITPLVNDWLTSLETLGQSHS